MATTPVEALHEEARRFLDGAAHGLLAGGERVESAKSQAFKTIDSATGEPICEVVHGGIKIVWTNRR